MKSCDSLGQTDFLQFAWNWSLTVWGVTHKVHGTRILKLQPASPQGRRCNRAHSSSAREAGCYRQDPRRSCHGSRRLPKEEGAQCQAAERGPEHAPAADTQESHWNQIFTSQHLPTRPEELRFRFPERLNAHTAAETEYNAGIKTVNETNI